MDREERKGTFSRRRLPLARAYVMPRSRTPMIVAGVAAAALLVAWSAFDFLLLDAHFLSNGPLSHAHAMLESEKDCSSCHAAEDVAMSTACASCHEPAGEALGRYGLPAHFVYQSDDLSRATATDAPGHAVAMECASCHAEHRGREAELTRVADVQCVTCHGVELAHASAVGSFAGSHPEFDYVASDEPEPVGLHFPHAKHLVQLRKKGYEDAEQACLYCHAPSADGRHFEPLSFDRACDACHLEGGKAIEDLPIRSASDPVGVESLASLRRRGERWALFANPEEYLVEDGAVTKEPVYHADPWVLENLRRLRALAYPEGGLANLLPVASAAGAPAADLYREAIEALRVQLVGLRGRSEEAVHLEIRQLQELLEDAESQIEAGGAVLDPAVFVLPEDAAPAARRGAADELAERLTRHCTECHVVDRLAIARVDESQRALRRARFDHRAHVLQRRCLECHSEIVVPEGGKVPEDHVDLAEVRNLPGIDSCRTCHDGSRVESRCTTCHDFHPSTSRPARLLRYVD